MCATATLENYQAWYKQAKGENPSTAHYYLEIIEQRYGKLARDRTLRPQEVKIEERELIAVG